LQPICHQPRIRIIVNRSFLIVASALVCCLTLAGCANKEKQLEGKWHATKVDLQAGGAGNSVAAMLASAFGKATLELTPDKKFTLSAGQAMTGDWVMTDKTASLTPKSFGGKTLDEMTKQFAAMPGAAQGMSKLGTAITVSTEDGKVMTLTGLFGLGGSMTFEKDPS
jgi:uncharacterized lipoprotein NlpE involved in copper resistance